MHHASAHDDTARAPAGTLRRGAFASVLLCLVLLLTALVPTSAGAAPKRFFGLTEGGAVTSKDYTKMRKADVKSFRLSVFWRNVEPRPGVFNWAPVDHHVRLLAENGITPVLRIWGAPQWVTGSGYPGVPPLEGKAKRSWKKFVKKAVRRYKKRGVFWKHNKDVKRKPVKTWQVWNEPNLPKYFARENAPPLRHLKNAPKKYAKFVKATDKVIHKTDRRAETVLAGLSGNPKKKKDLPHKFLKKFLKVRKIKKHFDAAALHPYAKNIKQYKKRVKKVRKMLNKKGAKKKEIWLTEVGWGSGKKGPMGKGLAGQAKMLKKSFKQTLKNRKKWKIERMFCFDWRDPPATAPVGCGFCPTAGLLKNDGTKKPAFRKFKHFTKR